MHTTGVRVALAVIVAAAIVALLAWARNHPGVDDRDPDPPESTQVVTTGDTVAPPTSPVVTAADTVPPTT